MNPNAPAPAPVSLRAPSERGLVEIERTFRVITPVIGGGVHIDDDDNKRHLRPIDPVTAVRGASIRGHLRFWWRLLARAEGGRSLHEREAALWGKASDPSLVDLRLDLSRLSTPKREEVFEWSESRGGKWNPRPLRGKEALAYGAFPLQGRAGQSTKGKSGVLYRLEDVVVLRCFVPVAHADEVRDALDAWLSFGGLGGRTRRGFGAVQCDAVPSGRADDLREKLGLEVRQAPKEHREPMAALEDALKLLQTFRQGVPFARNKGRRNPQWPGRSLWPEADELRRLTGQSDRDHSEPMYDHMHVFPRAYLGLPIVFHFKDPGDPRDHTLEHKDSNRMASPLIVRPQRQGDGSYRAMAVALPNAHKAPPIKLNPKPRKQSGDLRAELQPQEHERLRPMTDPRVTEQGRRPQDIIDAFLNFFENGGQPPRRTTP